MNGIVVCSGRRTIPFSQNIFRNACSERMRKFMKKELYEVDMCNGSLGSKILIFTLPLILSGILQLLFNAADIIVVGRYAGSQSLAAVGSNTALINLLINLFMGLAVGVNVLIARYAGAKQEEETRETVHTAIAISLIGGIFLAFIGIVFAKTFLRLMGTPGDVLDLAAVYLRIYFAGMPVIMLYNFGAAILRAVGDTKRPLIYLSIAGIINVILNLYFVIVMKLGVAGVGLATVLSQIISTALIVRSLMVAQGALRLKIRNIRIHKDKLIRIMRIGIPAGFQGVIFAISNVLIQSSVNSFGSTAMAGNSAAGNIEGFVYNSMNAFYQANVSFTSQNFGAKKYKRINYSLAWCVLMVVITGLVLGETVVFSGESLLRIYSTDAQVIKIGMIRLQIICGTYFLCGIMDVVVGSIRGLGYGILPMMISLIGACAFRIVWIFTVFQWYHTLEVLYISYPISWVLTGAIQFVCFLVVRKRLDKQ